MPEMSSEGFAEDSEHFRPPAGAPGWSSTACRRMCAATYLDSEFRDRLLREVYNARSRRVAPSYGYDIVPVLVHAWRAWRLEMLQHALILAIFIFALIESPLDAVIAASILILIYFAQKLVRLAADYRAYSREPESASKLRRLRRRGRIIWYGLSASLLVLAVSVLIALHLNQVNSGAAPPADDRILDVAVLVVLIVVILMAIAAVRQVKIGRLHQRPILHKDFQAGRLAAIKFQQHHPFIVYSGINPFIGSGTYVHTWRFVQRLVRADRAGGANTSEYDEQLPFTARELIAHLDEVIAGLGRDKNRETRLSGLVVADRVIVEGTYAIPYMPAIASPPESTKAKDAIARIIENSDTFARHYLACQVPSWDGDVVTSVFVHTSLKGRMLYLQYVVYALPPTRREYQIVDEVGATGPASVARAACKGVLRLPDAVVAPVRIGQAPREVLAGLRAQWDGTLTVRKRTNIGSTISAREIACGEVDESYFPLEDIIQHYKIVERRLIAAVEQFLKDRGVDTSEFSQRATTILNYGIMGLDDSRIEFKDGVRFGKQPEGTPAPDSPE
jgi:hypothetical protein